jgi:hypothetical protein
VNVLTTFYHFFALWFRWPTIRRLFSGKEHAVKPLVSGGFFYGGTPSAPPANTPDRAPEPSLDLPLLLGECSVCLEEMTDPKKCGRLPCAHIFHDWCIKEWLSVSENCPLCRAIPV